MGISRTEIDDFNCVTCDVAVPEIIFADTLDYILMDYSDSITIIGVYKLLNNMSRLKLKLFLHMLYVN